MRHHGQHHLRQVERIVEGQPAHGRERAPTHAQGHRRIGGQFDHQRINGGVEFGGRYHLAQDVELKRFLGRETFGQETHLLQAPARDHAHQERQDHHGKNAHTRFGRAKTRAVHTDGEVAGANQAHTAAEGAAVDTRDDGQMAAVHGAEQFGNRVVETTRFQCEGRSVGARLELATGAEGLLAGTGQHDGAHAIHGFGGQKSVAQFVHDGIGHGVVFGGAVDGDVAGQAAALHQHLRGRCTHWSTFAPRAAVRACLGTARRCAQGFSPSVG
ncbi:hypothetical protein FQZ97_914920 [compost metagenome]